MMESISFAGARWWKFDFHCHTRASNDYRSVSTTCREWLLACMNKGIDCVAITDHNSGVWIDLLKAEYSKMETEKPDGFRELYLFPGVEITAFSNIHVLAILPSEKTTGDIDTLLGLCGYTGEKGKSDGSTTSKTFIEVVQQITEFGGIAIPAHVDVVSGLFEVIKDGNTLPSILQSSDLFACEVKDSSYVYPQLNRDHNTSWSRVIGSDAHTPDEIGIAYTWVKMGNPCLEGLKLALMDNELSVKRFDEIDDPNKFANKLLKKVTVSKTRYCGTVDDLTMEFNPWLNCIIGGRGSGKSSMIEFARLAMRRNSELEKLGEDSETLKSFRKFNKIYSDRRDDGVLRSDSSIMAEYESNGETYRILWENTDSGHSTIQKYDSASDSYKDSPGEIASRFPVRFFSQKQIYEMASKPESLLAIINESPDIRYDEWEMQYSQSVAKFKSLRAQKRELEVSIKEQNALMGELEDVKAKLAIFEKGENALLFREYQKGISQNSQISGFKSSLSEINTLLSSILLEPITPDLSHFTTPQEDEIKKLIENYTEKISTFNQKLQEIKNGCAALPENFEKEITGTEWKKNFESVNSRYNSLVLKLREAGVNNPDEYGVYLQKKQSLESRLNKIEGLKQQIASIEKQAQDELKNADSLRKELSERRRDFLEKVLKDNTIVRMELLERGDNVNLEQEFRTLIGRDSGYEKDIYSERQGILAPLLEGYSDEKLYNLKNKLNELYTDPENASRRRTFGAVISALNPETIDDIDLWIPEDSIKVSYYQERSRQNSKPIDQGSPGQKTAAILSFLLSHGDEPIIMDQPEDDLDNHLIYDLVVEQIRRKKQLRQIIVVTHNANIVVNGDAELVHVFNFAGGQINLSHSGCLQERDIRKEICSVMEGGKTAFEKRYKRIHIEGL